jgi:type III pantothenate kinase
MWLLLDIGNSSTKAALHDGVCIRRKARFDTAHPDRETVFRRWASSATVDRAGAVSVVPEAGGRWSSLVSGLFDADLEFFDHRSALPFELVYDTPETLGNDRIAAAAAVRQLRGRPEGRSVIAVDTGTATTYEIVTSDGRYFGGPIAPGPELIRAAMHAGTAQLPLVDLKMPGRLMGAGTREAMQAGIMAGFSDGVRSMVARIERELGEEADLVLTGGWAGWLRERLDLPAVVEPDLVVLGVRELMKLV